MDQTHRIGLPYIAAAQAQKHVTHNEALRALDVLVQTSVASRVQASPPATPAGGDQHIVPSGATGAWSGQAGKIAAFQDGAWAFYAPPVGCRAWVIDEATLVVWTGTAWTVSGGGATGTAPLFGVNTTADTTNRLAVKSDAVLFSHDDVTPGSGDMYHKINKSAAGKTASVLFQTAYSGRAEFGLTGDDDWHVKVSPNGSAWFEALVVDRATGRVRFPSGGVRELLSAPRTYYVRTDGNDANNGLTNSAGGAFATWQKAWDVICATLDMGGQTVTVQIADGTYGAGVMLDKPVTGGGRVVFRGNLSDRAAVVCTGAQGYRITSSLGCVVQAEYQKLVPSYDYGIYSEVPGTRFTFDQIDFGAAPVAHIYSTKGAVVECVTGGAYVISGGTSRHFQVEFGGQYHVYGCAVTVTGTPAFGFCFALVDAGIVNAKLTTFTGGATGTRYVVANNGVVSTTGGVNLFPGNVAGYTSGGGQYQ